MAFKKGTNRIDNFNASTALLQGGILTQGTGTTTVNISAGNGTVSFPTGRLIEVSWDAFENLELTEIGISPATAIGIDASGNTAQKAGGFTDGEERDYINLGFATHIDLVAIDHVSSDPIGATNIGNALSDFGSQFGNINNNGNLIEPGGANLTLAKTQGQVFGMNINWNINQKQPNLFDSALNTGLTFSYSYRDGIGGFVSTFPVTDVDPGQYDDGSGTLASVPSNRYTVQRMYYFAKADVYALTYGQVLYTTLEDAINAATTEEAIIDPFLEGNVAVRSFISLKGNVTDLTDGDEADFIEGPKFIGANIQGGSGSGGGTLPTTTKGDLVVHNGSTNVRLPVGTEGQALTVSGATSEGVAWVGPTTFSNGLTKTGDDVRFGGSLTGATTLATGANPFKIDAGFGGSFELNTNFGGFMLIDLSMSTGGQINIGSGELRISGDSGAYDVEYKSNTITTEFPQHTVTESNGNISYSFNDGGGNTFSRVLSPYVDVSQIFNTGGDSSSYEILPTSNTITTNNSGGGVLEIEMKTTSGITITNSINDRGIEYISLQESGFTDNTLVHKKYVDDRVSKDPRVISATSVANLTIDSSLYDNATILSQAATLNILDPIGSPVDGRKLIIRVLDDGTSRTINFNPIWRALGVTLPSATTANKTLYIGAIYNSSDTTWDVVAVNELA